ncbi:MAG TPA: hypothetical protein PK229_12125 [Rhodocyclaceae bacterium]|nr:hypothetical protein [Rhodocyclaceae bacterium]
MLRKNVASQVVTFTLVNATTGAALTGATVTVKVTLDGTQSGGSGTVTELGTGQYKYVPTQAETNGSSVGFSFTATNAVPVNLHCFMIGQDPAAAQFAANVTQFGGTNATTSGGRPEVNTTHIGGTSQTARDIGASVLLSAGTGTGQLDFTSGVVKSNVTQFGGTSATTAGGRPEVNVSHFGGSAGTFTSGKPDVQTVAGNVTGSVGSVTGAVGSVTGNVGGNVTGSVGSVSGNVGGNVTGSVGSIASGGITRASFAADTGLQAVRSNTAQAGAAGTVTLDASASGTTDFYVGCLVYLTGGTGVGQARVVTAYNGTTKVATITPNWATNPDATSTFAVLAGDHPKVDSSLQVTAASVQGNVTGSVASVTGNVGGNVSGNVSGSVASIAAGGIGATSFAAGAIDAAAIAADAIGSSELATSAANEIRDAIAAKALVEPSAVPAVTATWAEALAWLLVLSRNLITQTATTQTLKADDGSTTIATSTHSDDGTTHSRGEWA